MSLRELVRVAGCIGVASTLGFVVIGCGGGTKAPAITPVTAPVPETVTLTYLGVAGWQLTSGSHVLLHDPYFSRREVDDVKPLVPDLVAIAAHTPREVEVVLVGHSHYDHLLDVPTIASKTGALVVGSESTMRVARAAGIPASQLHVVHGGDTFASGPFAIRVIHGLHSSIGVPSVDIPEGVKLPMTADGYGEGGTLQFFVTTGGRKVLFIGTANFIEAELEGLRPDVAIVATGLRAKIPDYTCRLMRVLGKPPLVLTNHFDAHWEPLGEKQMDIGDAGRASLAAFAEEVHACAPATQVTVPQHFVTISL